ncbi:MULTISPECIES: hypothetical protein, partial [Mesorhizobium]|uniref:hypothetical protein n=1 Tax=Mesorhizobium TaxID=68287 RepID=UPI00197EB7EE
ESQQALKRLHLKCHASAGSAGCEAGVNNGHDHNGIFGCDTQVHHDNVAVEHTDIARQTACNAPQEGRGLFLAPAGLSQTEKSRYRCHPRAEWP